MKATIHQTGAFNATPLESANLTKLLASHYARNDYILSTPGLFNDIIRYCSISKAFASALCHLLQGREHMSTIFDGPAMNSSEPPSPSPVPAAVRSVGIAARHCGSALCHKN